jgi:phosphoserine phosphatase RsbU/P
MGFRIRFGYKLLIPLVFINLITIGILLLFIIKFLTEHYGFVIDYGSIIFDFLTEISLYVFLASTALISIIVSIFSFRLKKLQTVTQALINTNFKGNEKEESIVKYMSTRYNDEISELSKMVLYMNSMLNQYFENLDETLSVKERMDTELNVAWEIQKGILPGVDLSLTERSDLQINATLFPAKDVGGDLYDYFLIDETQLFFLIGDVSDKGIPAAMFMTVTKTLFNTHAIFGDCKGNGIKEIVTRVNLQLSKDNPKLMFVTVFAGILNLQTGDIEYIDGGHESPFVYKENGDIIQFEKKSGRLPLGVMQDFEYDAHEYKLEKGDTIILYTDGVNDAKSSDGKRFGEEGIIRSLESAGNAYSPELVNKILMQNIRTFSIGSTQFDDIAILSIKYKGS